MKQIRNILVIADGFGAPAYNPRLRSICEYLHENDYNIQVVVEQIHPITFHHSYPIREISVYNAGKVDWAVKNVWSLLTDWKNRYFSKKVEQLFGKHQFDAVFCTTFHTFPLRAANDFAEKHHIPVLIDVRDIIEQAPNNKVNYVAHKHILLRPFVPIYQYTNKLRRNRQLRRANAITTVSPWHQQFLSKINPNTYLVYNGFDANVYTPLNQPDKEFILSYCGKFFGLPMHNPEPLFEALAKIDDLPYKLLIHTDSNGETLLREMLHKYRLEQHTTISGYVSNNEVLKLYRRSSIVLVFTNKASEQNLHGMMGTKFFEALGVEKPVLCVSDDEECLSQVISLTGAGISSSDAKQIKDFILTKYAEWKQNGFTVQRVNQSLKPQFSRQAQAKQITEILQSL